MTIAKFALMSLVKRGDRVLKGDAWFDIYTPSTFTCAETPQECWDDANLFSDPALCWVVSYDRARFTVPDSVQLHFARTRYGIVV